ncbi:hypothetical protein WISP_34765 [Willisornis vidua]|uniref:Uncharacterized protein n=1 Tax=Willisornis vidua TaxID=1566151 RepID=A0ABQ9DLV6_9PASS|nr:hypothetical protein WISP_34765 [Willisornis vidua]
MLRKNAGKNEEQKREDMGEKEERSRRDHKANEILDCTKHMASGVREVIFPMDFILERVHLEYYLGVMGPQDKKGMDLFSSYITAIDKVLLYSEMATGGNSKGVIGKQTSVINFPNKRLAKHKADLKTPVLEMLLEGEPRGIYSFKLK